jgi:hypothetical protein
MNFMSGWPRVTGVQGEGEQDLEGEELEEGSERRGG